MKKPTKPTFIPAVTPGTPSPPLKASLADVIKADGADFQRMKGYHPAQTMPHQSRRNNRKKG